MTDENNKENVIDVEVVKERVKELSIEGMEKVQEYLKSVLKIDEDGTFEVPEDLKQYLLDLSLIK